MMRLLTFLSICLFVFDCYGKALIWREDFSKSSSAKEFQAGSLQFYSDSKSVKVDNGAVSMISKSGTVKAYLTARIKNVSYNLSFDIFLLKDADKGYGRSVYFKGASGSPCLIEFKSDGGVYFYTSDSKAHRGWAVRSRTKIEMNRWYRIRIENKSDSCLVKIYSRGGREPIWRSSARHNIGGWGKIIFQVSGKPMGMLIDNVKLVCDDNNIEFSDTPPGVMRIIDPWKPASEVKSYKRIIAKRPAGIEGDAIKCWLADVAIRDGNVIDTDKKFKSKGGFRWLIEGGKVYLANKLAGYIINENSLWSIYDFGAKMECISKGRKDVAIWKVKVKSSDGKRESIIEPVRKPEVQIEANEGKLRAKLIWKNQKADIGGAIDVIATVELNRGDSVARWRISVVNHIEKGGLWRVWFPRVGNLGYSGESDVCSYNVRNPHTGLGDLIRKCEGPLSHTYMGRLVERKYPGGAIQMMSISCGRASQVYIAAEDGQGYYKGWIGNMDDKFEMFAYPAGTAQEGISYNQTYDILLGVMKGDWFDAAKRYRKWALKQKWCAKGKVADRKDIPTKFKKIDILLRTGLWWDPKGEKWNKKKGVWEITDEGKKWRDACGRLKTKKSSSMLGYSPVEQVERQYDMYHTKGSFVPVHTYMWHHNLFDDMYPDFLPAIKGFKSLVAEWQAKDMIVMPYINGWILDKRVPWFKEAQPYLARKIDGSTYDFRTRINTSPATTPCVYTEFWHNKIAHLAKVICDDIGCDGLYIDQTAGMPPVLCFDKRHGHPIGGGNWFGQGQRKLFESVRTAVSKPIYLSTEWFCEYYIDLVDDFLLIWGTHSPNNVPLVPAIYSGYTSWDGSRIASRDDRNASRVVFGRALLWGEKFGHIICLNDVVHNIQGYIQKLVNLRVRIRKFVQFGRMLRPPAIVSNVPEIKIARWDTEYKGLMSVIAPAVERSFWRASDGSLGLIVVNYSDMPQQVKFDRTFVGDKFTHLIIIHYDGVEKETKIGNARELKFSVPAAEAIAIEFYKK